MNSEEKFKELLKEKLAMKEFPFNLENWEKARTQIDDSRSKKRRIVSFFLLGLTVFITGVLYFYFPVTSFVKQKSLAAKSVSSGPEAAAHVKKSASDVSNTNVIKANVPNNYPEVANTSTASEDQSKKSSSSKRNITSVEKIKVLNNVDQPKAHLTLNRSTKSETVNQGKVTSAILAKTKPLTKKSDVAAVQIKNENDDVGTTPARSPESVAAIPGAVALEMRRRTEKGKIEKQELTTNTANNSVEETSQIKTEIDNVKLTENNPAQETKIADPAKNETPVAEVMPEIPSAITTLDKKENETALVKADTAIQKPSFEPKNIFSIEAGGNYHLAWHVGGSKDAVGLNPILGINYLRVISNKISLSIGLHYTTVGNLSNYSHTSKDTRYSFGETSATTIITPVKIQYLYTPLRLVYALNNKNMIGAGYAFYYLLTVNNKVENYTQGFNARSDDKITKTKGYSQGFNGFDSQVSIFYRRVLFSDLSLSTEIFYGLADIKNNTFFRSGSFDRNNGIKLTLIYNILKK